MPPSPPFLFPEVQSTVLPDPSTFFSQNLLQSPLPTNSFFQNFVLKNGDQHEYFHPYLIKSSNSSLSVSYPFLLFSAAMLYQVFVPDITISSSTQKTTAPTKKDHVISSYSDLGVTLDIPSSNLRFFLLKGSPFITASLTKPTSLSITTPHSIVSLFPSNDDKTKYTLKLNNNQTWIFYTSSPIALYNKGSKILSNPFYGIIRVAALPDESNNNGSNCGEILDRFSSCYPVSGDADIKKHFRVVYKWQTRRSGELLMLAHPLHLKLLKQNNNNVTVLNGFKYRSIDGDLVGVVGDSWVLEAQNVPVTWHSIKGVEKGSYKEIVSALNKDVKELNSSNLNTTSSYFYGKLVGRAARMALIAEEVSYPIVIPKIAKFLKETIEPWLKGTLKGNGFLYERKWGGLVTLQGSNDSGGDFGFGVYNDHHYHIGYFIYGISVLAKIDPDWGQEYKPQAYSLVNDFLNLGPRFNANYPRLRMFDLYILHSWASGVTEFEDGRNQESTSEAVNAYYAAALMGLAFDDSRLFDTGSTLLALEIQAAQTWWHVKSEDNLYEQDFSKDNRIVGILWSNKRDTKLWWASADCRYCRLSIQVLPLLPITEPLFSDGVYAKELVEWTLPSLKGKTNVEGWKGFTYALQGIYDKENALNNIRMLKGFDDGNSYTNLLWWIHSR
ncbi:probable endo-1,3(4)-beta-glucanase ARB_01444 [Arachis duranensis]|uniref:glucan endo-1,3-beta-D-glucosidase n=1 Tax=Arachis duranensis TaxID=130453 RepID=A0A6P4D599_ARADU|nr:probable endo-1,3(4)-beta-glucanase ARB_01444 [Arachis duranensis]